MKSIYVLAAATLAYGIYTSDKEISPNPFIPTVTATSTFGGENHQATPEPKQPTPEPSRPADAEVHVDDCGGYEAEITCRYGSCRIERVIPWDHKKDRAVESIFNPWGNGWEQKQVDSLEEGLKKCATQPTSVPPNTQ